MAQSGGQRTESFRLGGGLDLLTPAISKAPGALIGSLNHEPVPEGYRRIDGFERLDGQTKPSEASYWVLGFDGGTATIAANATVTGATSGATGKALVAMVVSSGSFGGSDAAGYLVLTGVSGTFQDDENLRVGGVTKCVADGVAAEKGATNDTDDQTWLQAAIEAARTLIGEAPGSGMLRGAWSFGGHEYAFRDNIGATACVMYKSTTAGWVSVALGSRVKFISGLTEIVVGNTVTGASSGATGVVTRVPVRTGAWDGSAAGQLIFASITGTFTNGENLQVGGVTKAVADGASAAITLPAGGRYEFITFNFFGSSDLRRMYGVNGVGPAFEFDGTVFVPLITGMASDAPNHIREKSNHLFLSFAGGSVQNSSIGNPYGWSVVTGASEMGMGDDVVGFADGPSENLIVVTRNKTSQLIGTSTDDFQLIKLPGEAGGYEWTVQSMLQPVTFDNQGLRNFAATQAFGDFKLGLLSALIKPLIDKKKKDGVRPTASLRIKDKNQYRLFFDDNTGLIMDWSGKAPMFSVLDYGMVVRCASSTEDGNGDEILLFGSDDGYVRQMDKGTSFDGQAVNAYIRLAFNPIRSPTQDKRFHKATLEVTGQPYTELTVTADFSYGSAEVVSVGAQDFDISGGGGFWDEANWNEFVWDAEVVGQAAARLDGHGTNISLAIASSLTYVEPYTLEALTIHWSPRKLQR